MPKPMIITTSGLSAQKAKEILEKALEIAMFQKESTPGDTAHIETRIMLIEDLIKKINEVSENLENILRLLLEAGLTDF